MVRTVCFAHFRHGIIDVNIRFLDANVERFYGDAVKLNSNNEFFAHLESPKRASPEIKGQVLESSPMKQIAFIVAALLFLLMYCNTGVVATGEEQTKISISDLTGNDLLRFCSSHEAFETNMCTG